MTRIQLLLLLMSILGLVSACTYDNEIDLYGTTQCQTADMSYQNDINSIMVIGCMPCHSTSRGDGNVRLETHAEVVEQIDRGRLLGSIRQDDGFSPMPQNKAKLIDCEIEKVASWIADGAQNN